MDAFAKLVKLAVIYRNQDWRRYHQERGRHQAQEGNRGRRGRRVNPLALSGRRIFHTLQRSDGAKPYIHR